MTTQITFRRWLKQQGSRDDPIGDLARDFQRDKQNVLRFFRSETEPNLSLRRFYSYLRRQNACSDARQALISAYREWQGLGNIYRETRDRPRQIISPRLRFKVFKRDGYRCQICGRSAQDGAVLELDHKVAVARGGTDDLLNLWTLCFECNRGKRDDNL